MKLHQLLSSFFLILFMVILLESSPANAQHAHHKKRPKIGLALSGGGAKGLSHIGALMVLEKAGVKVDYIVGTSMGSIIGALYAAGYSADTISYIARNEDWDLLLANNPGLKQISIEEKADYGRFILETPIENKRFLLPRGVIDGQELSIKLAWFMTPVYDRKKFTDFPIPFKCVATDITNGEMVLIDSGNISEAIRASMAIPSIFTPVKYEDKLLVDGGIVRNFPVQHVKEMGADIVIGVNLSKGFLTEKEMQNFFDILNQSMFLTDGEDTKKQRELCDILIEPDLTGYTAGSFASADSLIQRGYEAAMEKYDFLKSMVDSLDKIYGPHDSIKRPVVDSIFVTDIFLDGAKRINKDLIIDRMNISKNRWYKTGDIPAAIQKVYGTRYFRKIGYQLVKHEDGTQIRLKAIENPETFFKVALNYNSFTKSGLILNITNRNFLGKNTRFSATVNIAENMRFKTEYFKYMGPAKNYGFAVGFYYDKYDFPTYNKLIRTALYKQQYTAIDVKFQVSSLSVNSLGVGIRREFMNVSPDVYGVNTTYDGGFNHFKAYTYFQLNTLDRPYFARKGTKTWIECAYIFDSRYDFKAVASDSSGTIFSSDKIPQQVLDTLVTKTYIQAKIFSERYSKLNKHLTLISAAFCGFTINPLNIDKPTNTLFNNFMIGGLVQNFRNQIPFIGFSEFQLTTNNYIGVMFSIQWECSRNLYITPRMNAGNYVQTFQDYYLTDAFLNHSNYLTGYGVTFGYNSFLGPLEFTFMRSEELKNFTTYVNLGYTF